MNLSYLLDKIGKMNEELNLVWGNTGVVWYGRRFAAKDCWELDDERSRCLSRFDSLAL